MIICAFVRSVTVFAFAIGQIKYYVCFFILAQSFSRYHPSKGYWWQFKDGAESGKLHVYCA